MKRMTINEIERFIEKLQSTEPQYVSVERHKQNAITSLGILCDELEYYGKKSMKLKEGATD